MTLHNARIRSDRSFSRYPAGHPRPRADDHPHPCTWGQASWAADETDIGCLHRPRSVPGAGV